MKSIPLLVALAAAGSLVLATGVFAQEAPKAAPHAEKKGERHDHGEHRGQGCGGMHKHS